MGNTHSDSSAYRHPGPAQSESTETPDVSHPPPQDKLDTPQVNQTPPKENVSPPNFLQRRGSLMKFPSLRRRPRSVVGLPDQHPDSQAPASPPPSRRRWRALTGLKTRPVSALATPSAPSTALQTPRDAVEPSIPDPPRNEKGKERETDASESVQAGRPNDLLEVGRGDVMALGPSTNQNEEPGPSSEALLQGLRDLQDTYSSQEVHQSDIDVVPKSGFDAESRRCQVDRPPTPIPPSGMTTASGSRGGYPPDNSPPIALAEALGSWMSGRPRPENAESTLNDYPIASSSGSQRTEYSSSYANGHSNEFNASSSSQAAGAPRSPRSPTPPPEPPISSNGAGHPFSPRGPTLPPAGTGTLVVVQGVVHTTDVRHSNSRTTSTSRPTVASPTHHFRSSSSTPTLRTPTLSSSRSGSGASTPQAPSTPRRSRLSSFASGLRQRSRPHTPTSSFRTTAPSGWRHGTGESSSSANRSEILSDRSLGGLGISMERTVSDSEAGSIALSAESLSTSPVVSTDDTSTMESVDGNSSREGQTPGDPLAPQSDSHINQGESVEASTNRNSISEQRAVDDGEREVTSDEESEAELSASSIEILGTLLSVATAATAASLVTGTTEPLFTSGLAGPPPDGRSATSSSQNGSTGIPVPPLPRSNRPSTSQVGADDDADTAANTRMRAAWESLRERFARTRGRRGGTANDSAGEAREDPREQMLREMARVFNMGLGLDTEDSNDSRLEQQENGTSEGLLSEVDSPDTPQPLPESAADRSNRPIPEERGTGVDPGPEGSFERFLHNLQVDLRTALTEDYAARRARAQNRGVHASNLGAASSSTPLVSSSSSGPLEASASSNVATVPSPPADTAAPLSPILLSSSEVSSSEGSNQETPAAISSEDITPQATGLVPTVPNTPRTANLDLPHLPGEIDSQNADGTRATPQAQGITGQPGAGINWWRLYRFPPMQLAPHPSSTNADTISATGLPSSPSPQSTPSSQNPPNSYSESYPPSTENLRSEGAPTQNVVPVIVVGLQSVPVSRADPHRHDPSPPHADRFPSPSTYESTDPPSRDRAWPLRAASRAFNRMGRRAETDDPESNPPIVNGAENTGAEARRRHNGRTYLIFVIGGYYPPNHSIVTGADDMNSFEALWELADLLGQVKPPVASKEDIEKSGLEILKPSSLPEYQRLGKIASNTVERCLICLDDYETEDDLRLLSCRHIFHKSCVDKWLEQGRNNCPACRSKGVQTGDDSTSPLPMANTPLRPQTGN